VSRTTALIYGRESAYFIPHNFYSELRQKTFSPSLHHLVALSRISGYCLQDWLRLFGIDVEDVFKLQVRLPSRRTQLLDSLADPRRSFPALKERNIGSEWPPTAPVSQLFASQGRRTAEAYIGSSHRKFLYAKIGYEDVLSFPLLAAGSIVRVDATFKSVLRMQEPGTTSKALFLLEHGRGHVVCQLRRTGPNSFSTVSSSLPYPEVELSVPRQARILGLVDFEVRSRKSYPPALPPNLTQNWIEGIRETHVTVAQMVRAGRRNMNLSLTAASRLSHEIARYLGDRRYSMSISSLSDYEVARDAPRHLHKVISLCAIYGLQFAQLLKALGIALETCGQDPMPCQPQGTDEVPEKRGEPERASETESRLARLGFELADLPFLLSDSLPYLAQLPRLSVQDFFWIGGQSDPLHPVLKGAIFAIVNRRKKKPAPQLSSVDFDQQMFLLLKRNGTYTAGLTTLNRGILTVYGFPQHQHRPLRLRNDVEAEVVGQIVVLLRKAI